MPFIDEKFNNVDEVIYCETYYPYRIRNEFGESVLNPKFDKFSGKVLDIKEGKPDAIEYFFNILNPLIKEGVAIAYVPSHDPANTSSGIRQLAEKLSSVQNRLDATNCLVRNIKINKLTSGGTRSKAVHLQSISLNEPDIIKNKKVLLIDDVSTTNNSLKACREILLKSQASKIVCFALGQTEGY